MTDVACGTRWETGESWENAVGDAWATGSRGQAFTTKADQVYTLLKEWIQTGRLEPGEPLALDRLEQQLGLDVSRMPLREALARLQADGLVQARPHRTARVAPLSIEEMRDIYAAREALESMLARESVVMCDGAEIAVMEGQLKAQRAAIEDGDNAAFVRIDRDFHATLYRASGFRHGVGMVEHLRDISDRYVLAFASSGRQAHVGLHQHVEILEACRAGDAERVQRLTREHVRHGVDVLTDDYLADAQDSDLGY
jgi:DNA-binding GntR family transcriptional regulator